MSSTMWYPLLLFLVLACSRGDAPRSVDSTSGPSLAPVSADAAYLIDSMAVGPIRLGMTLDEARQAAPRATFARTSDGDGVAFVEVTFAPETTLVLYAGEADPAAAIDWAQRITRIETSSAAFQTRHGVRPGSFVLAVEGMLGPVREIMLSEIESREFITFERQPAWLTFRLDYTAIFPAGATTTRAYKPEARLLSIAIG